MSGIFNSIVPDISGNKYVIDNEYVKMAVDGCDKQFASQKDLYSFAQKVTQCFENSVRQ